jgi:hypothetical protein
MLANWLTTCAGMRMPRRQFKDHTGVELNEIHFEVFHYQLLKLKTGETKD